MSENKHPENESHPRHTRSSFLTAPTAILLSGVMISLSVLLHGAMSPLGSAAGKASFKLDTKVVADIVAKPVAHRYFADQVPTEPIIFSEYSDTECPFCKDFHSTMQSMLASNINGDVAWVFNHFPLPFHTKAQKEAEAIECVREISGDTSAFHFVDIIFAVTPANNGLPPEALPAIAKAMKIPTKKFTECLDSGKYADRVKAQIAEGQKNGVKGTPYTFVKVKKNESLVDVGSINGAQPIEVVNSLLDQARKK